MEIFDLLNGINSWEDILKPAFIGAIVMALMSLLKRSEWYCTTFMSKSSRLITVLILSVIITSLLIVLSGKYEGDNILSEAIIQSVLVIAFAITQYNVITGIKDNRRK